MNALTAIYNVARTNLVKANLRYCLMDYSKLPHKVDGSLARSNVNEDFVSLLEICKCKNLKDYKTLAVSIWASNVCAIDIDHCLEKENDINTASAIAMSIVNMFKDFAYIEYSFSGLGLRLLFRQDNIENYSDKFYIKNSKLGIEYYQPAESARYVSITGNVIYNNLIDSSNHLDIVKAFLERYMVRPVVRTSKADEEEDDRTIEDLMKLVKKQYMTNYTFQNIWFGKAPGSNSNESELDYQLIALLYETVTKNRIKVRLLFEQSPYYKSKDFKHVHKWQASDFRYFNRQFDEMLKRR